MLSLSSPTLLADISCGSALAGSHLVQTCRKTGDGTLWVGGWHQLCLVSSRDVLMGREVFPIRQPEGSQIPLTPLFRFLMGRD